MTDENALIRERNRGHLAKQVMDNAVYQDVWAKFDANLLATITDGKTPDDRVLEARRGLIILRQIKRQIEKEFQTGLMATAELESTDSS